MTEVSTSKSRGKSQASGWTLAGSVGGRMPCIDPVISRDEKHVMVLFSGQIRVYHLGTKQCISSIPLDTTDGISDMVLSDDDNVWISYTDGKCKCIEWKSSQILDTLSLPIPILKMIAVKKDRFVVLSFSKHNHKKGGNITFIGDIVHNNDKKEWEYKKLASLGKGCNEFTLSMDQSHYIYYSKKEQQEQEQFKVTIGRFSNEFNTIEEESITRRNKPSSLAISSNGLAVVGSITGVIDVYYNILNHQEEIIQRSLKWHMSAVSALAFSQNDEYLLSGGNEKVLVFWHLDTQSTQFLPRLSRRIKGIKIFDKVYSLRLGENELAIISQIDLNLLLSISGVEGKLSKGGISLMIINPKTRQLLLPVGGGYQVQTYNLAKNEQVSIQDFTSTIQTGKVQNEENIIDGEITQLCISNDGQWLLSVDCKKSPKIDNLLSDKDEQVNLKFWNPSKNGNNNWELSTRIQSPHGPGVKIVACLCAPNGDGFITACNRGGLRLWKNNNNNSIWKLVKIIDPFNLSSSAIALSWSQDSSLIIFGFESTLYIIDVKKFEITGIISNITSTRIRNLDIINNSKLICLSKTRICVYDIIKNKLDWSIGIPLMPTGASNLYKSNSLDTFAIGNGNKVIIFKSSSPIPIHIEYHSFPISSIALDPGTNDYVFMDIKSRLNVLTCGYNKNNHNRQVQVDNGGLAIAYAPHPQQQLQETTTTTTKKNSNFQMDKIFNGPEYAMGNLDVYFEKVLHVLNS